MPSSRRCSPNPSFQKLPDEALAAIARVRTLVDDPNLARSVQNLSRSLARLDRILGGGEADLATTLENLRQITDNLRDLTEDAKRYPANVLLGGAAASARRQTMTAARSRRPVRGRRSLCRRARRRSRSRRLLLSRPGAGQADVPDRGRGAARRRQDAARHAARARVQRGRAVPRQVVRLSRDRSQVRVRFLCGIPGRAGGDAGRGHRARARARPRVRARGCARRAARRRLCAGRLRRRALWRRAQRHAARRGTWRCLITCRAPMRRRRCRSGRSNTDRRAPVAAATPEAYAAALSTAFGEITAELARDLAAVELPKPDGLRCYVAAAPSGGGVTIST